MTATVLSLIPSTRTAVGTLKTTLGEAVKALSASVVTVALRDNGPKVNGTLVFVEGTIGAVGDAVNARSARNKVVYGPHLVLATVTVGADGALSVDGDLGVTEDTKAALFTVASTETAVASSLVAAAAAEVAGTVSVKRAKDGEVVASDVSVAEAEALIAKAKAAKKAALVIA